MGGNEGMREKAMRYARLLVLLCGWVFVGLANAGSQGPMSFRIDPAESRVWFDADARFSTFRGQGQKVAGRLTLLSSSPPQVADASVSIDAASLDTGNVERDADMRSQFLEVQRFPTIEFRITEVLTPRPVSTGTDWDVVLQGRLAIHGVVREVQVPTTVRLASDRITAQGHVRLDMRDFNIRVPRLLFVPMKSEVLVGFEVVARPEP